MAYYDPDKRPTAEDVGDVCPNCARRLMFLATAEEPKPHRSGDGVVWDCPGCGEPLHENGHGYVFMLGEPSRDKPHRTRRLTERDAAPGRVVPAGGGKFLVLFD